MTQIKSLAIILWQRQLQGIRSDRVPEELWMEVCDIVQEIVIKIISKKKKHKQAKWLPEEALQIAEKGREGKGKGERKRYSYLKQSSKE